MNKIATLINFRLKQVVRFLQDIGIAYILILLFVAFGLIAKFLDYLTQVDIQSIVLIGFFLTIVTHNNRGDSGFLDKLEVPKKLLYLIEYNLMLLPISLTLLVMGKFAVAGGLHLGILPVLLFPSGQLKRRLKTIPLKLDFIPATAFEFKAAMRRYFFPIILFYIIALACSFFEGSLVLLTLFFILIIPSTFEDFEPKEWIETRYEKRHFLLGKVEQNLLLYHLLLLPHYILFLVFHWHLWYIALACAIALELVIVFSIVYKYTLYRPQMKKIYTTSMQAVFLWTMLSVGFIFVSIFLIIRYWRKANKNLAFYYAEN